MATVSTSPAKSSPWLGILPFIGIMFFLIAVVPLAFGKPVDDWQNVIMLNAIVYMIGWQGIGGGISHIFFGDKVSQSIGFGRDAYEIEVGAANLAFGIVGLLAPHFDPQYWLAIILASSLYRIVCGIGHVYQMASQRNFAINNTLVLVADFGVPAFLLTIYYL